MLLGRTLDLLATVLAPGLEVIPQAIGHLCPSQDSNALVVLSRLSPRALAMVNLSEAQALVPLLD